MEAAPVAGALRFELLSEGRFSRKKPGGGRGAGDKGARGTTKSATNRKTTPRVKNKGRRQRSA